MSDIDLQIAEEIEKEIISQGKSPEIAQKAKEVFIQDCLSQ